MLLLSLKNAVFAINDKFTCSIKYLDIHKKDLVVLFGANGSGKTSIARSLAGEINTVSGHCLREAKKASLVSFEGQAKLFEDDYKFRNSDMLNDDELLGIKVSYIFKDCDSKKVKHYLKLFNAEHLIDRSIKDLSGGEGRKILIIKALSDNCDLLVFDTPFDALDKKSRCDLKDIIDSIHENTDVAIVLIVNRVDEIPDCANKFGLVSSRQLNDVGGRDILLRDDFKALFYITSQDSIEVPKAPLKYRDNINIKSLIKLKNINLSYEREIFHNFNFEVNKGEHYQIIGPNGCGKSTLISFITGDNPKIFVNDVTVCGYKRGCGESIWDIKKNIGIISSALHLDYRVSSSVLNVVLSGFYDSIGLYTKATDDEIVCAKKWLTLAGLLDKERLSFKELSFGEQRLVLILRSLVKMPKILILDEPLQGLDSYARDLIKEFISIIVTISDTTVLFVSHHDEDKIKGIKYTLSFVKNNDGGYDIIDSKHS